MPQVFISHSSADRPFVEAELLPLLRLHGITPWYAAQDIDSASVWEAAIRDGLNASEWLLVVVTPSAITSPWVHAELHWALASRGDRIIPVLAGDCKPEEMSLRLIALQWIDFREDIVTARNRLLAVWGRAVGDVAALEVRIRIHTEESATRRQKGSVVQTLMIRGAATIGRAPGSDILLSSPFVSRTQALLKVRERDGTMSLWLYNVGSSNATMVNGEAAHESKRLAPGDTIECEGTVIEIIAVSAVSRAS